MPSVLFFLHGALAAALLVGCEPKPPQPKTALAAEPGMMQAAVILQNAPQRATEAAEPESLASLRDAVGSYPYDETNYLEQGVLAARLRALLGERYPRLLSNLRTVSPLTEADGLWFITGNRPHEGGVEAAAVVIDPRQNALRVWLLNAGKVQEFIDPPAAQIPWPKDVQTLLQNQGWPAR